MKTPLKGVCDCFAKRLSAYRSPRPALSLYVDVDRDTLRPVAHETRLERIAIESNLRHDLLDEQITESHVAAGTLDVPHGHELVFLWHFARALLEGMAEGFHRFGEQMAPVIGPRTPLVGAGNGIRRNRLLAAILSERFAAPLHIPALAEEAAVGAAIVAAVGQGEFPTLEEATARLLAYAEVVG